MKDIVLIHGGYHGGACFDLLIPELNRRGYRTFAPDLPIDRPGVTLNGYGQFVTDWANGKVSDDAIFVGHSNGANVITRVANQRPVGGLIYICGGLPARTREEHEENLAALNPDVVGSMIANDDTDSAVAIGDLSVMPADVAKSVFYHDVPEPILSEALEHLRAQWLGGLTVNYQPVASFPNVPLSAILCSEDRILAQSANEALLQRRYGIAPAVMGGSHSPFLSQPKALADLLHTMISDFDAAKR